MLSWLDTAAALMAAVSFPWALRRLIRGNLPLERELYDPEKTRAALLNSRKKKKILATRHNTNNQEVSGESKIITFPIMKLPPELRRKIWTLSLPGPRLIEADDDISCSPDWKFKLSSPDPNILHVCYESRAVALEHYQPLLKPSKPIGYFNPSIDILHFTPGAHLFETDFQDYNIFKRIRQVAILAEPSCLWMNLSMLSDGPHGQGPLRRLVLSGNLDRVLLVFGEPSISREILSNEESRLEPIAVERNSCPEDKELFDAVESFQIGLVTFKERIEGLDRVPDVVPVRCVGSLVQPVDGT